MPVSCHHTMPSTVVEGAAKEFRKKEENHQRRISAIGVRDAQFKRQSRTRQLAQVDIYKAYSNTNYDVQTRIQKRLEAIVLTHYNSAGRAKLTVEVDQSHDGIETHNIGKISIRRKPVGKRGRGKKSKAQLAALRKKRFATNLLENNNNRAVGKAKLTKITSGHSIALSRISEKEDAYSSQETICSKKSSRNSGGSEQSFASVDDSQKGFRNFMKMRTPEEIQNMQRRSSFQHTALATQAKMARLEHEREKEKLLSQAEILEKRKKNKKRLQKKRENKNLGS